MDAYDKDPAAGQVPGPGPDGGAAPEETGAGGTGTTGTGTTGTGANVTGANVTGTTGTGATDGSAVGETVAAPPAPAPAPEPRTGVAALSPRYQIGAVVALAVVAVAVCAHLGLVFLHVAPSNTLTKQHGAAVDEWVFPEFEQNWKLFAPNPLQQNVSVQVRAEVGTADGGIRTTGWYDLSAEDGRAIAGNPLPSHTRQNELRRAWDFFVATHDSEDRPVGLRGSLSETYLRRIALLRLDRNDAAGPGGVVERVQYRSRTTNVEPPSWSGEKVSGRPTVRELPWWSVAAETGGASTGAAGAAGAVGREGGAA
ncbi:DUF5819 family protein [Streptomyces salinarius]|uniref:DUF5819 family protein n=1 Tax=Streptomyces salinarius TaxID=2762598 RepID=UPI0028526C8A|nr:DUF5819 family protein [Streptomyces salinarius]